MQAAPPAGGAGTLTISTSRDCTWAASSGVSWIVITSGSSGQGDGTAAYRIAANTENSSRRGAIDVNSTQVAITQDAACRYDVSAPNTTIPPEGSTLSISVQSGGTCEWTAVSQSEWIVISSGSSGTGNGTVNVAVAANHGGARSGTLLVAGRTITVAQAQALSPAPTPTPGPAPPTPACDPTLTANPQSVPAEGGSGVVSVALSDGCAWSASSNVPWITIAAGASGTGNGQVRFTVAANPDASARQGVLTIAGRAVTIAQAGTCIYTIQPTSQSVPATGGTGSVTLTTTSGCSWQVMSNAPWISIAAVTSGTGNGTVSFSVLPNTGTARTGTLTVGGQTFTVNQAAPCSYSIAPQAQGFSDQGGSGTIAVTTTDGSCSWTATASVTWIVISGSGSGTGNGSVTFTVARNTGAARSGTVTIAGQTSTVTQSAPAPQCSFTIAPTSQALSDAGGSGTVAVTTGDGCAWTAVSNAPWIGITSGSSGTGNGSVAFTVAANTGAARSGTITVAGQTFTVNQAAPQPCSFTIAPTEQMIATAGGQGTVTVTASGVACTWTAASGVDWVTIGTSSGSGSGSVSFSVAPNTGDARSGTLTIAGLAFTVRQTAANQN
jgi:hypothetical protein